jgi:hypothetical protein
LLLAGLSRFPNVRTPTQIKTNRASVSALPSY